MINTFFYGFLKRWCSESGTLFIDFKRNGDKKMDVSNEHKKSYIRRIFISSNKEYACLLQNTNVLK